jgi:nucleoside 2-deoxyribosyltransferase
MKIFIICSVRGTSDIYKKNLEKYVCELESQGHSVHLPHRDTKQDNKGIDICKQNRTAIESADEIHIFYSENSQGTHFDMGVAFTARKPIKIIQNVTYGEGKSFPRMLSEWEKEGAK